MRIGIDASNIRAGGGITHLKELLSAAEPEKFGISKVTVWGCSYTLDCLPLRHWLIKIKEPMLDASLLSRLWWQRLRLPTLARAACDLLFVPGGSFNGGFSPTVVMAQNLLPFDVKERRRYGLTFTRLRLFLLNHGQSATMRRAQGVIFLSEATRSLIKKSIGNISTRTAVIPHGIGDGFHHEPRQQLPISAYSIEKPFRLLYVSIINLYKHQWNVVEAVSRLRSEGFPIVLDLVGPAYPPALKRLDRALRQFDPTGQVVKYHGSECYETLPRRYYETDGFVFASTCETISLIIMEAMASGLPIACSDVPPMPEVLENAGIYFPPENVDQIVSALKMLISDSKLREDLSHKANDRAKLFTWKRCSDETFSFLASFPLQVGKAVRDGNKSNSDKVSAVLFHDSIAESWEAKYMKPTFALRASAIMSKLEGFSLSGQKWLDAGCGTGVLSLLLAERGCSVTGIDASATMIEQANMIANKSSRNFLEPPEYHMIDTIENLNSFEDSVFNGVLCSSVFEYLDRPIECLHELWRVLTPGGYLLITVPNKMSLIRYVQKKLFKMTKCVGNKGWPTYINHSINDYTKSAFSYILQGNGFEVTELDFYGPQAIRRYFGSLFGCSIIIALARKVETSNADNKHI